MNDPKVDGSVAWLIGPNATTGYKPSWTVIEEFATRFTSEDEARAAFKVYADAPPPCSWAFQPKRETVRLVRTTVIRMFTEQAI